MYVAYFALCMSAVPVCCLEVVHVSVLCSWLLLSFVADVFVVLLFICRCIP